MADEKSKALSVNLAAGLSQILNEAVASGDVVVADLFPSLNAQLSDPEKGGMPGKVFVGDLLAYEADVPMPDLNDPEETRELDTAKLKDLTQDFQGGVFQFYAGNGGLKAKLRQVRDSKAVLVIYAGEMAATKKGWNPPKDFKLVGFKDRDVALATYAAVKKAVAAAK